MSLQLEVDPATPNAFLDRVSLLLDAFGGRDRLTLAEIVRRTGLPRSSAHRILDHLVQLRWLHRSGRDYTLGLRLVELGSLAVYQDRLHSAAHPHLYELHRRTGLIVEMTILDGSNVVCRAHMAGRFASMIPNRIGFSTRADGTLVGRVLHTFNNERGEAADEVRKTGVGYGCDTPIDGFGTIATPIGPIGVATSALSICGPLRQMPLDERNSPLTGLLRETAASLWRNAGVRTTESMRAQ